MTVTHTKIFMTAGLILVSSFAASCGSKTTDDPAFDCDNPLAEAGEDISVSLGSAVTLDGGEVLGVLPWQKKRYTTGVFVATPADSSVTDQNFLTIAAYRQAIPNLFQM